MTDEPLWVELARRQLENDISKAMQGLWDREYFMRFGIGFPDGWRPR